MSEPQWSYSRPRVSNRLMSKGVFDLPKSLLVLQSHSSVVPRPCNNRPARVPSFSVVEKDGMQPAYLLVLRDLRKHHGLKRNTTAQQRQKLLLVLKTM